MRSTFLFIGAISLFLAGCGDGSSSSTADSIEGKPLVYSGEVQGGVVSAKGDGQYEVTLSGVPPQLDYAIDTHHDRLGSVPTDEFASSTAWSGALPHAALVIDGAPDSSDVAILELSNPRHDGSAGTLRFDVTMPANYSGEGLEDFVADNDAVLRPGFGHAKLLMVDSDSIPCGMSVAGSTLIDLADGGAAEPADEIIKGTVVRAFDNTAAHAALAAPVYFSAGTGASSIAAMLFVVVTDAAGHQAELVVSPDTCLLTAAGAIQRADHLRVGDQLSGADGAPRSVSTVAFGEFRGAVHSLATRAPLEGQGRFLSANGVLVTEYLFTY